MSRYSLAQCSCGSGLEAPQRLDGHGIFLIYACDKCWPNKLKKYCPDIMERYEGDDPIEPEDC